MGPCHLEFSKELAVKKNSQVKRIFIELQGSLNKFPDFFRMGTFIDSTHIKL